MNQPAKTIVVVALAAAATASSADLAEIKWDASGVAAQEFNVPAGKFAEWCGKLRTSDRVEWRFEGTAPIDFNVHYHLGKEVQFPAKQEGVARAEGVLAVSSDQDYCWMWTNRSAGPVTVKVWAKLSH